MNERRRDHDSLPGSSTGRVPGVAHAQGASTACGVTQPLRIRNPPERSWTAGEPRPGHSAPAGPTPLTPHVLRPQSYEDNRSQPDRGISFTGGEHSLRVCPLEARTLFSTCISLPQGRLWPQAHRSATSEQNKRGTTAVTLRFLKT